MTELFEHPTHPYTLGLLKSRPDFRATAGKPGSNNRLTEIPGMVPALRQEIVGCPFASRCRFATLQCQQKTPPLEQRSTGHWVACWQADQVERCNG